MAISDVCKFELKANVDRVQEEKSISRRQAIARVANEIGLIEETARKQDQRARRELGQIVPRPKATPKKSTQTKDLSASDVHDVVMSSLHLITSVIGAGHPGDKKAKAAMIMKVHATMGKFIEAINAGDDLVGVSFTEFKADPADIESLVQCWGANE